MIPLDPGQFKAIPRPGGWEFIWEDLGIAFRFERLREHADTFSAMVWAERTADKALVIGGLRFNLVSPMGRGSIVKALAKTQNSLPWDGMVDQACIYTLRKFHEQEKSCSIGNLPLSPELRFCLKPLLPLDVTSLIFGYGGTLKSTLAYLCALLVRSGETRLGLQPSAPGPVLFLDWETNLNIANDTFLAIEAGMHIEGQPQIIYRRCRRPFLDFIEDVLAEAQREGVILTVMDSFTKACGGEKEAKENATPTLSALDSLPGTKLALTHRPKGIDGKEKGAYGSAYIEYDVRQSFQAESKDYHAMPDRQAFTDVVLHHHKHNLMASLPPLGFRVTWDKLLGTKIERRDPQMMSDLRETLNAPDQIAATLRDTPKITAGEIAEATGLSLRTIYGELREGRGTRFVELKQRQATGRPTSVWANMFHEPDTPEVFK